MNRSLDDLRTALTAWEKQILEKTTSRFPEREACRDVSRFATPVDLERTDFIEDIGFPGEFPFTRGVQPTMYRGRFWTMRQYAGFGTARESNERYRYLLNQGQTGLSVAFDLPTQIGYDSDDPMALGEVGKVGVAIDTLADMEILFDQIPLDKVSTSMTINASAAVLLAMYIAVAEKRGIPGSALQGTIQNDILKEYIARGTYIFPPEPSMRLITDIFHYCAKHVPKWNTISISGYHIREAGSTAVQEIGFTLADGIAYCEAAIRCGLDVDTFGGRLSFFFNAHNNLLEEVAKFRAARRLWARIMRDRFGATSEKALTLRFHCQTGGSTLTAQQVDNNIVRVTLQALAAVLGGTQSLHTNSRDEALALPTEDSVRIALRTQQIIANESGVADTIDPLGGAWYVEKMTNDIETGAVEIIRKIDEIGGMVKAIEEGYVQRQIQDSAYRTQQKIDSGRQIVVGVNKFTIEEPEQENLAGTDPMVEAQQVDFLRSVKTDRNSERVHKILQSLREKAQGTDNLVPIIIEAVKEYASLGEICNVLRSVFGEFQERVVL
ncbi:methylmalonyl-CoA mutase family protein [bacterium]|nr:methylmalonyl-CoA mutase family protein [candidate division CSSED10-310 bacterium]